MNGISCYNETMPAKKEMNTAKSAESKAKNKKPAKKMAPAKNSTAKISASKGRTRTGRAKTPSKRDIIEGIKESCQKIVSDLHELSKISPNMKPKVPDHSSKDIREMEEALFAIAKKDQDLHLLQEKFTIALNTLKGELDHSDKWTLHNLNRFIDMIDSAKKTALHLKSIYEERLGLRIQFNHIEALLHEKMLDHHGYADAKQVFIVMDQISRRIDSIKREKFGLGKYLYSGEIRSLEDRLDTLQRIGQRLDSGFPNIEWSHEPDIIAARILKQLHMALTSSAAVGIPDLNHEKVWKNLCEDVDSSSSGWRICSYISGTKSTI